MLKKAMISMFLMSGLVNAVPALAGEPILGGGPIFEPGPEIELGDEIGQIADILLQRGIKDCVEKFQDHDTTSITVTRQNWSPEHTIYKVRALILQGGDMVMGNVTLTIHAELVPDLFWPEATRTVYRCDYSEQKFL